MTPVIAIVGCPNVGKSTLFNRLTRSRSALVANEPGVTRDRQYGYANLFDSAVLLIDTGGMIGGGGESDSISGPVTGQTRQAMAEADAVIWLVDGRAGLSAGDLHLADTLRALTKPVFLLVNKTDGMGDAETAIAEFHSLGGFGAPLPVSAETGGGIDELRDLLAASFPETEAPPPENPDAVRVSVAGRPNVGKSTLINRLTGEDRMLTSDVPGTTRDSIPVPFRRRRNEYVLTDTAGIRRRSRVTDKIEKFSILKSLKAIAACRVVILMLDARALISDQDQTLLGMIGELGKSLVIAVNKWDGLSHQQKAAIRRQLDEKAGFADYACIHYISALHGTGVGKLFDGIDDIIRSQQRKPGSATITGFLREALTANPPPLVRGRRIALKYAHLGGFDPVRIIIHGNQTQNVPVNYQRYLSGFFRKRMKLIGTPVFIEFSRGDNPYGAAPAGRRTRKRRRAIKHGR